MNELTSTILIFTVLQLINVMLNTGKTLIMTRTDSPHMAALINAITFGFYTAVVKQIASLDLIITIVVTVITNVIGVYVAYAIMGKLKKDNLWKIEIFTKNEMPIILAELEHHGIPHTQITDEVVTAYAYAQEESEKVAHIIKTYKAKYNITEIMKRF